jgi:tetratricopeptide (TPR) repeat protein
MMKNASGIMRFRALAIPVAVLAGVAAMWGQATNQSERAVFISGDVRLEDGSPPQDAVLIQQVCNGRAVFSARTDARGYFSFPVDTGGGVTASADASQAPAQSPDLGKAINRSSTQYTNPITTALRDCEVQAVLSGFRTETVALAVRSASDDGRIGTIVLHPLSRLDTLTISVTTAAASANARKAYEKGMEAFKKQEWDAAGSEFTKAVKIYPKFAIAWYQLGQVRQNRNDPAGAAQAWNEARMQDPKYVKPYESLAAQADRRQDWTAAEQYSAEWLQLDPDDYAAAYLINAVANARLDKVDAAEHAARQGLRIDRDRKIPRLNYVLGLILLQKQEFAESAKCFRTYLELAPDAHDAAMVREELSKLERGAVGGPPH